MSPLRPRQYDNSALLSCFMADATNVIRDHETRTVSEDHVMFALVERKLRQIERRRACRVSSREVGLIVAQAVADAVRIDTVRVSLDVTQSCVCCRVDRADDG